MENLTTSNVKQNLLDDIENRVKDKILEPSNAQLLKKLILKADDDDEAMMIAALGTTYKRTGFHFDKRLEKLNSDIKYFSKWTNLLIAFILCYLFEVFIDLGFQRLRKRDSALGHFLIDSKLLLRIATIVFMAIVTWIILLVFVYHSKYIDAVLILAALGILIESRRIYNAAIKALSKNHNWWILKNSLLNNNIFK